MGGSLEKEKDSYSKEGCYCCDFGFGGCYDYDFGKVGKGQEVGVARDGRDGRDGRVEGVEGKGLGEKVKETEEALLRAVHSGGRDLRRKRGPLEVQGEVFKEQEGQEYEGSGEVDDGVKAHVRELRRLRNKGWR